MDRKWRFNRAALETITPFPDFEASLPSRDAEYDLANVSDLYAVYTVLHIEKREVTLHWSSQGRFYYFVAVQHYQPKDKKQFAAAPEGDEDMPEVVVNVDDEPEVQVLVPVDDEDGEPAAAAAAGTDGDNAAQNGSPAQPPRKRARSAASDTNVKGGREQMENAATAGTPGQQQQQQQQAGANGLQQQEQEQGALPPRSAAHIEEENEPEDEETEQVGAAEQQEMEEGQQQQQQQGGTSDQAAAATPARPTLTRTQILVPVSSGYSMLTPELLQRLFCIRGVQAQQLLLALVDTQGVVTRNCLYNYIQGPLAGPGTANLILMDD